MGKGFESRSALKTKVEWNRIEQGGYKHEKSENLQ